MQKDHCRLADILVVITQAGSITANSTENNKLTQMGVCSVTFQLTSSCYFQVQWNIEGVCPNLPLPCLIKPQWQLHSQVCRPPAPDSGLLMDRISSIYPRAVSTLHLNHRQVITKKTKELRDRRRVSRTRLMPVWINGRLKTTTNIVNG